ncbi:MAG: hypothetical protein AB8H80_09165 [Planctomycetota bacterium]
MNTRAGSGFLRQQQQMLACLLALLSLLSQRALAQRGSVPGGSTQRAEAGRAEEKRKIERRLDANRLEVDRLLDMRLRHDLGLLRGIDDTLVQSDVAPTGTAMDGMRRELKEQTASATVLRQRYEQLRAAVQRLREDSDRSAGSQNQASSGPAFRGPGSRGPMIGDGLRGLPPRSPAAPPRFGPGESRTANAAPMPGGETARPNTRSNSPTGRGRTNEVPSAVLGDLALDPLRAQIQGSKDHQRVAQSLFKAGQALMDRADDLRRRGELELAKQIDDRAKTRLEHAVRELAPLLAEKEPTFVSLFYLGRCRELLFRYGERHEELSLATSQRAYQQREQEVREPFLQITARDVVKTGPAGTAEVLGAWGQAAKTAMEHFRWMNLNGSYDARAKIRSLTWPGEKRR